MSGFKTLKDKWSREVSTASDQAKVSGYAQGIKDAYQRCISDLAEVLKRPPAPELSAPIHVYVAGPYRAATAWQREQNIRRAEEAGFRLAEHGLIPVIPHTMYRHFDGELTDEFWLSATISLMERCDALVLLPAWTQSAGSKGEHDRAFEMGMPIFDVYHSDGDALAAAIRLNVAERRGSQ